MREAVTVDSASREFDGIRIEIYKAQKICLRLNTEELSTGEIETLFSELTGKEIPPGFTLLPPFYCDYGKNIRVGKNTFINFDCTFMDLGGITIEDDVRIAPQCKLITENHDFAPDERHIPLRKRGRSTRARCRSIMWNTAMSRSLRRKSSTKFRWSLLGASG